LNQELRSVRSVESVRISVHSNSLSVSFSCELLGRLKEKNEKLLILFFVVLSLDWFNTCSLGYLSLSFHISIVLNFDNFYLIYDLV